MSLALTIHYPEHFPNAIGKTQRKFVEETKWEMAVKLFEQKRISSSMAAILIGIDRVIFLMRLQEYNVPMIDLTKDEILSDLANA
jgi:predicted HTH domain antitoxin